MTFYKKKETKNIELVSRPGHHRVRQGQFWGRGGLPYQRQPDRVGCRHEGSWTRDPSRPKNSQGSQSEQGWEAKAKVRFCRFDVIQRKDPVRKFCCGRQPVSDALQEEVEGESTYPRATGHQNVHDTQELRQSQKLYRKPRGNHKRLCHRTFRSHLGPGQSNAANREQGAPIVIIQS